ncbi:arginine--tRNA ligase [Actinocorallia sp. A-T 12471]|uniref:arginine--tRNA ligase n=1 Tax=Actinocorallia sp. A-T 12471 TaxID=3089813 RepID=UPI0029D0532E|nr:arginine--tRNA ligase [Actinocorallia sp. A-T 12471]MDX6738412.1 arginine--tRNA ligase [Actinocorallia sp. A-T 12471]
MSDPQLVLAARVQAAIVDAFGVEYAHTDPVIRPSQFADLQANVALPLAKKLGERPRDVADEIVKRLDVAGICSGVEVSGPGFVNLTLSDEWIAGQATPLVGDTRVGVPRTDRPQVIPVDYSAPNVAKEMHVGHLRTTVVGDAFCRAAEFRGHHVIRQNHIGDWGTPFGMLIEHLLDIGEEEAAAELRTDPNVFYQAARAKFDASDKGENDSDFAARARRRVVLLQSGDNATLTVWRRMVDMSKVYFNKIYAELDVTLSDADLAGESKYNDMLGAVCDDLYEQGIAVIDDGALCVFLDGFTGREGKPVPLIIRKSDGGYGYATTDLAALRYRAQTLHADRVVYVIGIPQALHLKMVFETVRKAGWLGRTEPFHAGIGNVLGTDGKILRTRSGKPIRLAQLLEEAVERAAKVIEDRGYDAATQAEIAEAVGIGAVKYADLSVARDSEYVFDFDRMIALTGNTGPYLQYAAARIRSIFRLADADPANASGPIVITHPAERALALHLLGFGAAIDAMIEDVAPHKLAAYLYGVADALTGFYENCPVVKGPDGPVPDEVRAPRLALCSLALNTLVTGLGLLGITVPERM